MLAVSVRITGVAVSVIMKDRRLAGAAGSRGTQPPCGLPHAEHRGEPVEAGLHADADQHLGADAELAQPAADLAGVPVQLGVGPPLALELGRAAAGLRAARAAMASCTQPGGTGAAVSFHSISSAYSSASVSTGSADSRADGSATAPRSSTSRWPSSRSTVAASNSPVL